MACFWTPMSVEVTALPVYPAASLSRPYHSPITALSVVATDLYVRWEGQRDCGLDLSPKVFRT